MFQLYLSFGFRKLVEGQRQEAAERWRISILGPNNEGCLSTAWSMAIYSLAYSPLIVELGDYSTYNQLRAALLEANGDTDDPGIAERIIKSYLLRPFDAGSEQKLNHVADVLRHTTAASSPWYSWANLALVLFEYRKGNYAEALRIAPKDADIERVEAALRPGLKATTHIIAGMALYQLGQTDKATLELAQYGGIIETNFSGRLDLGSNTADTYGMLGPWHDWWTAHILLREAEALIGGQTNAPAGDVKAKAN